MCPFHYNLPTGSGENDDASSHPGASFPSPEVELSLSDLNIWEAGAVPTQGAKRAIPRPDGRGTDTGRALTFPPELKILLSPRGARISSPMGEKTNSMTLQVAAGGRGFTGGARPFSSFEWTVTPTYLSMHSVFLVQDLKLSAVTTPSILVPEVTEAWPSGAAVIGLQVSTSPKQSPSHLLHSIQQTDTWQSSLCSCVVG